MEPYPLHPKLGLNYEEGVGIFQSFPIVVVLVLTVVLGALRSRWITSKWRLEQLGPVAEIDELVRIIAGLYRRSNRRGDPRSAAITKWVQPFLPMIDQWEAQKAELKKQASFTTWLKLGMPKFLVPDYRSATLQLHARSAVAPILDQFNAGPVMLEGSLGDDLWRALNVDLPDRVPQAVGLAAMRSAH